jgi:glycosyltransferase involved in cell wall biosynthesis
MLTAAPYVLLSIYVSDPERGSEPGVGFRWIKLYLDLGYRVIALIHRDQRGGIERTQTAFADAIAAGSLVIVAIAISPWQRLLNRLPWCYYAFYYLYQKSVFTAAKRIVGQREIRFIHHVTLNGFREPGLLWRLNRPFIWGPVGGLQNANTVFLTQQSPWARSREIARNFANSASSQWSPRPRCARAKARLVLAANGDSYRWASLHRAGPVRMLLETAVDLASTSETARETGLALWVGSDEPRKNPEFALVAYGLLARVLPALRLVMVGLGPERVRGLEQFCHRRDIPLHHISFAPKLDRNRLNELYASAKVMWFTSYRDTSGNVMLEAMRAGCPVIAFNHQGAASILEGIGECLVEVGPYRRMAAEWARKSRRLLSDDHAWTQVSARSLERIRECFCWDDKGAALQRELFAAGLEAHA